jgi:hypothetical protein
MRTLLGLQKEVELVITPHGVLIRNPEYMLVKKAPVEKTKNRP